MSRKVSVQFEWCPNCKRETMVETYEHEAGECGLINRVRENQLHLHKYCSCLHDWTVPGGSNAKRSYVGSGLS